MTQIRTPPNAGHALLRGSLVLSVALLVALPSSVFGVDRSLFIELTTLEGAAIPQGQAPQLTVLQQGAPLEVFSLGRWQPESAPAEILLYFDLPLSTPDRVRDAASSLAERVSELAALGDVRILVARSTIESLAQPSRDPELLKQLLLEVERNADDAGTMTDARAALEKTLATPGDHRRLLIEHFFAEDRLRTWQQHLLEDQLLGNLLDATGGAPEARPRLLFLVRDALDHSALSFVEKRLGDAARDPAVERRLKSTEVEEQRTFARTVAALGWRVFAFRDKTNDADPENTLAPPPDDELTEATAGEVVSDPGELSPALARLANLWRSDVAAAATPSAEPAPLDISAGSRFRASAPRWTTDGPPEHLAIVRARRLVEDDNGGTLRVAGSLVGAAAGGATVEAAVDLAGQGGGQITSRDFRVTVISRRLDRDPESERWNGGGDTPIPSTWLLRAPVRLHDDLESVVLVVENLRDWTWGATLAEEAERSLADDGASDLVVESVGQPAEVEGVAVARAETGGREARDAPNLIGDPRPPIDSRARKSAPVLRLVPPRQQPLVGRQTFKILLSNDLVRSVQFYLDDDLVLEDKRKPFEATIDLGEHASQRRVKAVGLSRAGAKLGEDSLTINQPRRRTGIRFTSVEPRPTGAVDVAADLVLTAAQQLDRVEFSRNGRLGATLTRGPYRTTLAGPTVPDADFVRVVAYMTDGTFLEDVQFVGGDQFVEEVDVNLVEVFTVVTDKDGQPVDGLERDDFELRLGRQEVEIERFAVAEQVPLVLGLVIDTSESMWTLMDVTRNAASRFLGDVLSDIDKAFLVDFDNQPRLAHPISGDVFELVKGLGRLQANGSTALYDSILFSLLQFGDDPGRRAVVLLTDGDDYRSRFSFNRVHKTARAAGLPLYFLALSGFDEKRPQFRKHDLEVIAEDSGGRVFYVTDMASILGAYDQIAEELRSQYLLTFTTTEELTDAQLAKLEVRVSGRGYEVRRVVGRR